MIRGICAHFEVKLCGRWAHYSIPRMTRDYRLFEKLAGVGGSVDNAISPPRDLPEDATNVTMINYNVVGGEYHSWINSHEFLEFYDFHKKLLDYCSHTLNRDYYGYLFGYGFNHFHKAPRIYPKELQDFRMVFWFVQ